MRRSWLIGWGSALAGCLAAAAASAGVEDSLGLGPRAMALGGALSARSAGFASVYYNPAGIVLGDERASAAELAVGAVYARPVLRVEGLESGDASPESEGARSTAAAVLGIVGPVGERLGVEGLFLGAYVYLPGSMLELGLRPDDSLFWQRYTDRTRALSTGLGLGWRLASWLSLGAAVRVASTVEAHTTALVVDVQEQDTESGASVVRASPSYGERLRVSARPALTLGLLASPTEALGVGLVYRSEVATENFGSTRVLGIEGIGDFGFAHHFFSHYEPARIALGVSAAPASQLTLSTDLTYSRWSAAPSPNAADLAGRVGDTLGVAVGVEWQLAPRFALLSSYAFEPSPFDNFGGPTNLLDNDRHVVALGGAQSLANSGTRMTAALELAVLPERSETKDRRRFATDALLVGNPGYPGYRYGGVVPAVQLALEVPW